MNPDTSSRLQLVTPPVSEPLSLSEAKLFLRIEHTADDALVTRCITAARMAAEEYTRLVFLPQSYVFTTGQAEEMIALPVGPAQSITLVQSFNQAGVATTVSPSNCRLTIDGFGVLFANVPMASKIAVTYVANYAASVAELPALIKQGMLHHIAAMMEQRGGNIPLPMQAQVCYQPFRRVRL